MQSDTNLVWIDLEMTGLAPERDVILEIATIITDSQLNHIADGPVFVINQPENKLAHLSEWVLDVHTKSGLLGRVRSSTTSIEQAQAETLAFIANYCTKGTALLAGNSVWQDRAFLYAYMPDIINFLHYRLIDISTIKTLVRRWYPHSPHQEFKKDNAHRALEDIRESIEELKSYKKYFFIAPQ